MRAAAQDLAELPGVVADMRLVDAVDRRLDDHRRRAVARAGRPALDQPAHIVRQPGHVERAVLHADIDVVGPGAGVLARPARGSAHGRYGRRCNRSPGPAPAARSLD